MGIFESIFDILYISVVIGLGLRLLLENKKGAKLFGIMAILLGLGDACHLIPRVISHLSPLGFKAHSFALSWGEFVTSITMTLFYVLYFYFYRNQSGDKDNKKLLVIHVLAAIRIVMVLLPQNQWGEVPGNYLFGIYRNIPFFILELLLIIWSYKSGKKESLKHMALLITLSFLFYLPVVLWSRTYPLVGALMIPKTVAYMLIVISGYRYYINKFTQKNLFGIAFVYLIMGLLGGVFYRELTKLYSFTESTHLAKLHVHLLVLGFIVPILFYIISLRYSENKISELKKPILTFIFGLTFTVVLMAIIGIYEVVGEGASLINTAVLDGISGLGHIFLSVGLVWTIIRLYRIDWLINHPSAD